MTTPRFSQKPATSKKMWIAPSLEIIEIKSKTASKLIPGANYLDPHGTAS
ncbi:hypothetical protein [Emticicia sp. BO119]|nr:hypothetical protein [Emticicia sp. BO119]MBA4848790.1 hypothetical protein [Emticicia sp. BO119]